MGTPIYESIDNTIFYYNDSEEEEIENTGIEMTMQKKKKLNQKANQKDEGFDLQKPSRGKSKPTNPQTKQTGETQFTAAKAFDMK